jgi:hypothetical protein
MLRLYRSDYLCSAIVNYPVVIAQFIETVELWHVQGTTNNIKAVGDCILPRE